MNNFLLLIMNCGIILDGFATQVGTVLLSGAFLYDIFWVFVSTKLFKESVMIVVSNPLHFSATRGHE